MVDYYLSKSSTYNFQRLNAMMQYKLNNTDERMYALRRSDDPAERALARLIDRHTTSSKVIAAHRAQGKQTEERIAEAKQAKQAERSTLASAKAGAKAAVSTAHLRGDIWDVDSIDERVEGIKGAQAQTKALGTQLDFYKVRWSASARASTRSHVRAHVLVMPCVPQAKYTELEAPPEALTIKRPTLGGVAAHVQNLKDVAGHPLFENTRKELVQAKASGFAAPPLSAPGHQGSTFTSPELHNLAPTNRDEMIAVNKKDGESSARVRAIDVV
jgi:hypothetical protein